MKQSIFRRYLLLFTSFLIGAYFLLPSFWQWTGQTPPSWFVSSGLKLGLDLQGGTHLTLQVDVPEAVKSNALSRSTDMVGKLKGVGILLAKEPIVAIEEGATVTRFEFKNSEEREKGRKHLETEYRQISLQIDPSSPTGLLLRGDPREFDILRQSAIDRSLEILRSRIDQFGVAEPVLIREGEDRIVIQLPGLKDEKRAIKLIGTTAQLEFRIVHDSNNKLREFIQTAKSTGKLNDSPTESDYQEALSSLIPTDAELAFVETIKDGSYEEGENIADDKAPPEPIIIRSKVELTGSAVVDAGVMRDQQTNEPNVHINLSPQAAHVFEDLTAENVGKRLAIVLDGKVKSYPNITEKIGGGQVRITGQFTDNEAADLAMVLRSGALPAPIKVIQNLTVGPTLGRDSVNAGLMSGLLGFLLVCFFMMFYYKFSGAIANVALLLNNVLLMGALAALDATLTLPGIAGIVLTMGMAVDSNVLIFERMREELDAKKPVPSAVRSGFDKAWWTIIDSHVTTLITAFVLFQFGTGPIKGFAVTLIIGVILNLFTALVGTKVVYDHLLMNSRIKSINFRLLLKKPNLDYIGSRRFAFAISTFFISLGLVSLFQISNGKANLGIDFAGGTMLTIHSSQPVTTAQVRDALAVAKIENPEIQTAETQGRILIRLHEAEVKNDTNKGTNKSSQVNTNEVSEPVMNALKAKLPAVTFNLEGVEQIGSAVSKDLRNASFLAVIMSIIGIVGYLAWRFDFRFGVAAAVATIHDVMAVLTFFYITGKEINLLLVTALLTLAGYSLTDTVVVFDRVRETRQKNPDWKIRDVINLSVNEVLSRTIITSTTVLLVLVALYLFGGSVLHDFSFALLLGIFVGTYSSVFVASPILYVWEEKYGRLNPPQDDLVVGSNIINVSAVKNASTDPLLPTASSDTPVKDS